MYGLQGFFSKIVLIVQIFSKIVRIVRISSENVRILKFYFNRLYVTILMLIFDIGTVRVPAPVQYAHKLAYLVGTSIHQAPAEKLSKLLYYL